MSESEENFDLDNMSGSESDDFEPVPKKKAAPLKKNASKPAAKPAAKQAAKQTAKATKAVTKKKTSDKENDTSEDESDYGVAGASAPSRPAATKQKTASETYQKVSVMRKLLSETQSDSC